MIKSKCCGAEAFKQVGGQYGCKKCENYCEIEPSNNPIIQTDEEIKKILYDFANNVSDRDGIVDEIDSEDFKICAEPIFNYFHTLQEEYKKELIEKIEKTGGDLGEGRVLDIAWSDLKQNIITIINNTPSL